MKNANTTFQRFNIVQLLLLSIILCFGTITIAQVTTKTYFDYLKDDKGRTYYAGQILEQIEETNQYGRIYRNIKIYRHGKGIYYYVDNQYGSRKEGNWVYDNLEGIGTLSVDGYNYEGNWKNDKKDGKGKEWHDGSNGSAKYTYEGNFLNDQRHGYGRLDYGFMTYEGNFEYGNYSGKGKITYDAKNKLKSYIGDFVAGYFHGNGVLEFNNGDRYKGSFVYGKMEGEGEYFNANNGTVLIGRFENNIYQTSTNNNDKEEGLNKQSLIHDEENCLIAKKRYLKQNPDVAKNGADAWVHYSLYGKNEGRKWPKCEDVQVNKLNSSSSKPLNSNSTTKQSSQSNELAKALAAYEMNRVLKSLIDQESSYGEIVGNQNTRKATNVKSSQVCYKCKPYNSKGHYIQDYDANKRVYINGRYILRPGYIICSSCRGTGNCKAYNMCSSSKESNRNYTCQRCRGDRFEICPVCRGSGVN